jgi:MFS family permease
LNARKALYTPTFFIGFAYNFFLALHFTNNALYPLYVSEEGGSAADIGIFMAVYSIAAVLGRPLIGYLIDKKGVKLVLIVGSLCMALPNLVFWSEYGSGLSWFVWIVRLVQGFGFGAHFSAGFTLAGQIAPEGRRNESMAMYGVSGLLGAFIGPAIGEYLESIYGLESFFILMIVSALAGTFIIMQLKHTVDSGNTDFSLKKLSGLLKSPELRIAFILAMLLSVCYSTPGAFIAKMANERSLTGFGLYFTGFGAGGITIRLIGSTWGDRFGLRRVLLPAFTAYFLGLIIVYFSYSTMGFLMGGLMAGVAHGLAFPAIGTLGFTLAPRELAGSAMSLTTGMMDAGTAITALFFGIIAEYSSYGIVFPMAASAALIAVAILIYSLFVKPIKIKPTAAT